MKPFYYGASKWTIALFRKHPIQAVLHGMLSKYVIQRDDKDTPEMLTISDTPIAAKQFDFCFEDINEEELLNNFPQGVSGKLLSVTLFRGKRTFTFFLTDEVPTLSLIFQNEFNVNDTLYLTAQTKRKVSLDRSFAVCCGQSSAYDDNTEIEYESETSSLSYPLPVILCRLYCLTSST